MYQASIDELHQMLVGMRRVADHALAHGEEMFSSVKHSYTLYGPYAYFLGVTIPSRLTPDRSRVLKKTTRREKYIAYELDSDYKIVRTVHIKDHSKITCTFHHFEMDGISYACAFYGTTFDVPHSAICAIKYVEGKPLYYAAAYQNSLFVQFYEYISDDKMIVSTYRYLPIAPFTEHGYRTDPDAPIGAPNSPVQCHCTEEVPNIVDFSQWFK